MNQKTTRYLPTREEITEACDQIQSEWSERELRERAVVKPKRSSVPLARCHVGTE